MKRTVTALATLGVCTSLLAHADSLTASAGIGYSSGRYTAPSTTDIVVAPFSVRYATGPVRLTATLPYLYVNSVGTVLSASGVPIVVTPGDPNARKRARDGIGDVQLGITYTLPASLTGEWLIDFTARAKLPTARRSIGLGTGKADMFISTEVSREFGRFAPFVNVGYRFLGDPPGFKLRNSISTSVGTSYQLGRTYLIASYDYTRATTTFVPDAHELFGGVSGPAIGRLTWTAFGTAGLSKGAPDYGVGMLFSYKLH